MGCVTQSLSASLLSQRLPDKGMLFHTDLKTRLKTLRVTAWKLSSIPSRIETFQTQLSRQSLLLPLEQYTKVGGKVLLAGVAKGAKITFTHLSNVLDFLQTKSERLAVNTIKGYVTASSRP